MGRRRVRLSGWVSAILFCAASNAGVDAAEIEFRHINDLFSASPMEDDLYTATLGIGTTVDGWTLELDEYLFTDKSVGLRFDETYLTVTRELLRPDSDWSVRARVGGAHVGRGLYGQRLQNFVHSVIDQEEVNLTYVSNSRAYVFARLNVTHTFHSNKRVTFAALVELESAGFKEHARVALNGRRNLGGGFALHAEVGTRFSDTSYAPLVPWLHDDEPTFGAGVGYKDFFDLTWTSNYFGTDDNHWHVLLRARFGSGTRKRDQAGTVVSRTPFSPPQPLAR